MAIGYAPVNLGYATAKHEKKSMLLPLLLKLEAWLERRESSRILYQLDDRELADIGLSRADVEGLNTSPSWQAYLPPSLGR